MVFRGNVVRGFTGMALVVILLHSSSAAKHLSTLLYHQVNLQVQCKAVLTTDQYVLEGCRNCTQELHTVGSLDPLQAKDLELWKREGVFHSCQAKAPSALLDMAHHIPVAKVGLTPLMIGSRDYVSVMSSLALENLYSSARLEIGSERSPFP